MKFSNPNLVLFLLKVGVVFILWYIVYEVWLLEDGRLDEWLSLNIIGNSIGILEFFNYDVYSINRVISINGQSGIEVVNGCNGVSAVGLFMGFIIAYPGEWKKKASFCVLGIAVIYLSNLIRIIFLTIAQAIWPSLFQFTHDYATTTLFYIVIFGLWMVWVNYNDANFAKNN